MLHYISIYILSSKLEKVHIDVYIPLKKGTLLWTWEYILFHILIFQGSDFLIFPRVVYLRLSILETIVTNFITIFLAIGSRAPRLSWTVGFGLLRPSHDSTYPRKANIVLPDEKKGKEKKLLTSRAESWLTFPIYVESNSLRFQLGRIKITSWRPI